jgi:hypothetical protein
MIKGKEMVRGSSALIRRKDDNENKGIYPQC